MHKHAYLFALLLLISFTATAYASQVNGAIFTTTANGARVNANLYTSKCEVYLDGGPGPNAPAGAAGLVDGEYYFQVTDPSGKNLLSTDIVTNRKILVQNGVIVAYIGYGGPAHATGYDLDHPELGAITVRAGNANCPADYLDSPNGTYKIWATPVQDFVGDPSKVDSDCGNGCFHGFVPSKSKTDNFRAKVGTNNFCLTIWKRVVNDVEVPGVGWKIVVTDPVPVDNTYYTDSNGFLQVCGLTEGTYTIRENLPTDWMTIALIVNGVQLNNEPVYSFLWKPGKPEPVIVFKNTEQLIPM